MTDQPTPRAPEPPARYEIERLRAALESLESAARSAGKTQGPFGQPYETVSAAHVARVARAALDGDSDD